MALEPLGKAEQALAEGSFEPDLSQSPDLESSEFAPKTNQNCSQEELERLEELIATSSESEAIATAQEQIRDCEAEAEAGAPSSDEAEPNPPLTEADPANVTDSGIVITVTGTRTPRALQDSAGSITVLEAEELERQGARDIGDVVRYEPGVSVGRNANRFGNQGFNIRGIAGNRVLILQDGIRIPDNYVGRGRDYQDLDGLDRIEIVRGAASALYGSDAIGGVVAFTTRDPQIYLEEVGDSLYTSAKLTYDTTTDMLDKNFTLAGEEGDFQALVSISQGNGSEFKNFDQDINPQSVDSLNLLGKLLFQASDRSQFKLTGEFFSEDTETELLNELTRTPFNVQPAPGRPLAFLQRDRFDTEDEKRRRRLSLTHNYENEDSDWLQRAHWNLYYQDADISEQSIQGGILQETAFGRRGPLPPTFTPIVREEENSFDQDILGGDLQLESNFFTGDWKHRLTYGFDLTRTETVRRRDNTLTNLITREQSKFVIGEEFPNKTFPDTKTLRGGLFLQNEIEVADGRLSLIPGLRLDYYSLRADNDDPDFQRINVDNYDVEDLDEFALSPKFGIVGKVTPELSAYFQYARGFRSPPYDDANVAFTNFAFGYTVLPNGDLKPETSNNFEVGLKGRYEAVDFDIAAFYNRYNDFIDTVAVGTRESDGFSINQSQNLGEVRIWGLEAGGEYRVNPLRTTALACWGKSPGLKATTSATMSHSIVLSPCPASSACAIAGQTIAGGAS
ncbi:MAG: TonB-dependent hemoglobin/transferrin/lactoferrin family receptor [Synechococcales cyanobacterium RU_4_20]|nr:TonB-dependent hemoglobin/transferrin/lactoferrin family receptor [Synechococcales cyanobacterium RU_4_20]